MQNENEITEDNERKGENERGFRLLNKKIQKSG